MIEFSDFYQHVYIKIIYTPQLSFQAWYIRKDAKGLCTFSRSPWSDWGFQCFLRGRVENWSFWFLLEKKINKNKKSINSFQSLLFRLKNAIVLCRLLKKKQ